MRNLVKYWMTHQLIHVSADEPARRAFEEMDQRVIHHVLVCDEANNLEGIVSDRDTIRVIFRNAGRVLDVDGCTVGSIMTRPPLVTIGPDATLELAAERMLEAQVNALPVFEGEKLVGILTHQDILGALVEGAMHP